MREATKDEMQCNVAWRSDGTGHDDKGQRDNTTTNQTNKQTNELTNMWA